MQMRQSVALTFEVSGSVFSKLCLRELAVGAFALVDANICSWRGVCGVPAEQSCVRQVFDFVNTSCQCHFNTQNCGCPDGSEGQGVTGRSLLSLFSASPCFELMMNVPKAFASLESIPHLNSFVFFGVSVKNKLLTAFKVRPRDE